MLEKRGEQLVVRYDHDKLFPRSFPPPPQAGGITFCIDPQFSGPSKPLQTSDFNMGGALIWDDPPTTKLVTEKVLSTENVLHSDTNLKPSQSAMFVPSATPPTKRSREDESLVSMMGAVASLTSVVGSLVSMQSSNSNPTSTRPPLAMFDPITMDSAKFAEETRKTNSQTMVTKKVIFGDLTVPKNIPKDHFIFYPHIWMAQLHFDKLGLAVVKSNLDAAVSSFLSRYRFSEISKWAITSAQEAFDEWLGMHVSAVPSSEAAWRLGIMCLQPIFMQFIFVSKVTSVAFAMSSIKNAGGNLNYHEAEIAKK